jgi:hypothetical protein
MAEFWKKEFEKKQLKLIVVSRTENSFTIRKANRHTAWAFLFD